MSEEYNNGSSLKERLKNLKINRSAVIAIALLVVSIAVITAVAIVGNRAKTDTEDTPRSDSPITLAPEEPTTETEKPNEDKKEETPTVTPTGQSKPVDDKLPSFVLPVSGALYKEHDPTLQVFSNTMNDYRVHIGVDIVTENAAPVYAAADGKIDKIWEDTLMGYCIAVKHSGDCYTIYKNLAETLPDGIAEGVSVRSGQLIASVGESAMVEIAEEPHLHFEMTVGDLSVDPLEYFDEKALASLGIDASHEE